MIRMVIPSSQATLVDWEISHGALGPESSPCVPRAPGSGTSRLPAYGTQGLPPEALVHEPLGVAPEYQELVDMGCYSVDEADGSPRGHEKEYDDEIPWVTDPKRTALRVSLKAGLGLLLLWICIEHQLAWWTALWSLLHGLSLCILWFAA